MREATARIIGFDIADAGQVEDAFKQIMAEAGAIDILINNAGITRDGLIATDEGIRLGCRP